MKQPVTSLTILFCFLLFTIFSYAQKEDYVWYFGPNGAGLDFSECAPRVLNNANSNNVFFEGAASMCDKNTGEILFYTDGVSVYNANHAAMPGNPAGLWNTNTQNIIIPKPGSNTIYYLISPEPQGHCGVGNDLYRGMIYSVIDMSLNSGLGGIVSAHNYLLDTANCEKITAVRNSNGQDIWLIGHKYGSNRFFTFNVTSNGIDSLPIYYNVGPSISSTQFNCFDAIGELKASPNGRKLAFTTFYSGFTALFNFDNATGVISNPLSLDIAGWGGYGLSFSPDNSKLYIGCVDTLQITNGNSHLFQFDLSSGDPTSIQNSRSLIYTSATSSYGSLKLAPNGKIYATLHTGNTALGSPYLEVINSPNNSGLACDYVHNGLSLNGLNSSWGLNNIMEGTNYCQTTGVNEIANGNFSARVYPNPSTGVINVSLTRSLTNGTLHIFNAIGMKVYSGVFSGSQTTINCPLPAGVYFVELTDKDERWTQKIIKE